MKFIFADSLDYVDPRYDFASDEHGSGRTPYWDDCFPHELLEQAPYDGILVSRSIVGDHRVSGKYSESQSMRFRRVGASRFFRLNSAPDFMFFGDCGAFSYHKEEVPPYRIDDTLEFYSDGRFTHGASVDHIIFEYRQNASPQERGSQISTERFELTLQLAKEFLDSSRNMHPGFIPVGVVQGWSAHSMARAATELVKMGYKYIAIGGLVPLKPPDIHEVLTAVSNAIDTKRTAVHLLGFAKADNLREFVKYGIASFDTTSPLTRAFKDKSRNYYLLRHDQSSLEYYTAIRIPQALENARLQHHIKSGRYEAETLVKQEKLALDSIRKFDKGKGTLDSTLSALRDYARPLFDTGRVSAERVVSLVEAQIKAYSRTLEAQPWKRCNCKVCRDASVDVVIFRASNRNKRRGIHNLVVFRDYMRAIGVRHA